MQQPGKRSAAVFDFDGTLVDGGPDKGVHLLYAAWVACFECGYAEYLHPDELEVDVERMLAAYQRYPGAPRFEQLSAVVNGLLNATYEAVDDPAALGVSAELQRRYPELRDRYNELYSRLNDVAAREFWRPFPSAGKTLERLHRDFDLYVASGVVQSILEEDFDHHGFDRRLFTAVLGSDTAGGRDKGVILASIKARGYREVLFVGDSPLDQEYAKAAGARFFRISGDGDFDRLLRALENGIPDDSEPWSFSERELAFYRTMVGGLLRAYRDGEALRDEEICRRIHA